jgi:hypothetical protein
LGRLNDRRRKAPVSTSTAGAWVPDRAYGASGMTQTKKAAAIARGGF